MKKEWGISNGINPIMYLCPESNVTKYINIMLTDLLERAQKSKPDIDATKAFLELFGFIKPYAGEMLREGKIQEKNFYDEREWRYVPPILGFDKEIKDWLNKEEFMNEAERISGNIRLERDCTLSFQPADIKYIVVKEEREILPMIEAIERIKVKYNPDVVKLLSSRIISAEQIKADF